MRQRKRTRNANARNQNGRVGVVPIKSGYTPTAARHVVSFDQLKGSEKKYLIMREWARRQGMYVGADTRGLERKAA